MAKQVGSVDVRTLKRRVFMLIRIRRGFEVSIVLPSILIIIGTTLKILSSAHPNKD